MGASRKNMNSSPFHRGNKMPPRQSGKAVTQNLHGGTMLFGLPLKLILPAAISVIILICFSFSLHSYFVHWDDQVYVYDNPFIKNFSLPNLKMLLFHITTAGNYHPLTMLSLAVNYHFSGLSPFGYHLTNIALHIINTVILFFVFVKLFESMETADYGSFPNKLWLAALGALWHGIHPMHVESVSWISERKDLLYALFYFLGIAAYLRFLESGKRKTYLLIFILFLFSMLSKPAAVVFPFTLLAIDYLLKRKFTRKIILEKLPFFILSLLLGIYTYSLQSSEGAMSASFDRFTFFQRCFFACYTFMMYVVKAGFPLHLSSLYPYSKASATGMLPIAYLLSPIADIAIVGLPLYLAGRAGENCKRIVVAGLLIFFINVALILKFVTVGGSIINDRYTYVPYIGLFLIALYMLNEWYQKYSRARQFIIAIVSIYSLMLCVLCYQRTWVWYNTQTLWEDVKGKFPMTIEDPYSELGEYYRIQGAANPIYYDSALVNYKILKRIWRPKNAGVYCNMANIYALKKDYPNAFECYSRAIEYQPSDTQAYLNRALTYINMNQPQLAIPDLNKTLLLDSNLLQSLQNRAYAYYVTGNYRQSLADYTRLVRMNPEKRGEYMFDISILYNAIKNHDTAMQYAVLAQKNGYALPAGYLESLENETAKRGGK